MRLRIDVALSKLFASDIARFNVQKLNSNILQLDLIYLFEAFPTTEPIIICLEILARLSFFPLKLVITLFEFWNCSVSGFSLLHSRRCFVWGEDFAVSTIRDTIFAFVLGNSKVFISFVALLTLVLLTLVSLAIFSRRVILLLTDFPFSSVDIFEFLVLSNLLWIPSLYH